MRKVRDLLRQRRVISIALVTLLKFWRPRAIWKMGEQRAASIPLANQVKRQRDAGGTFES